MILSLRGDTKPNTFVSSPKHLCIALYSWIVKKCSHRTSTVTHMYKWQAISPPSLLTLPKLAWKSDSWYEIDKEYQENSRKSKMSNFLATNNKMKYLMIISYLKELPRFMIRWVARFCLQDKNILKYTPKILHFNVIGLKLEIRIISLRYFHS